MLNYTNREWWSHFIGTKNNKRPRLSLLRQFILLRVGVKNCNKNWELKLKVSPFIELTKFISLCVAIGIYSSATFHIYPAASLSKFWVWRKPGDVPEHVNLQPFTYSIKADVGLWVLKVKPQIRRVSGYIILCMYYLHSMYSSHPLSTLFS